MIGPNSETTMSLFPELHDYNVEKLKSMLNEPQPFSKSHEDERTVWLQEVAHLLAEKCPDSRFFFEKQLSSTNTDLVRAAIFGLSHQKFNASIIASLLSSDNSDIVADAIQALTSVGDCSNLETIRHILHSKQGRLKSAAMQYVVNCLYREIKAIIDSGIVNDSSLIRMTAVDLVDDYGLSYMYDQAATLIRDPSDEVRQAVAGLTERITDSN